MIAAGRLDRRIALFVMGPATFDGMRSKPGGWRKLCDRWAGLTPLSGAERVAAAENAAVETLKFRVRRDALTTQVTAKTGRLLYNGVGYEVQVRQEVGKNGFDLLVTGRPDIPADPAEWA